MSDHDRLDLNRLRDLANKLQRVPRVLRIAGGEADVEDLATEAASSLLQIQRACGVLFDDLLPQLSALDPETSEFTDVLDDIAEEYRLIHYQIVNTRLFNYVVPSEN